MKLEKFIISAPFGNLLGFPGATSTLGTFTYEPRGGVFYRAWRMLKTLRWDGYAQSWSNRLGLPNPGIGSLQGKNLAGKIVSIHGFNWEQWYDMQSLLAEREDCGWVELNLSCPNTGAYPKRIDLEPMLVDAWCGPGKVRLIAKLPPVNYLEMAEFLYSHGVRIFHCCNTLPSSRGGVSGKKLKPYSLAACATLKQKWGEEVTLIGGGGITGRGDVGEYQKAGASHFALGSWLLNPLNWPRAKALIRYFQKY